MKKNALRLSIAAGALAFGGALFAQSGASPTDGSTPGHPPAPPPAPAPAPGGPGYGPREGRGPDRERHRHQADRMPPQGAAAGFAREVDTNRDGQISRDEVLAAHKRQLERFDQADTNKDGVLSREELRASRDAMREEHRKRAAERRGAGQQQPAPASGAPQPAPQTKG